MGRLCTVCTHPQHRQIDNALLARNAGHWGGGYRAIASRFGLDDTSLRRHEQTHLRDLLAQSKEIAMLASNESLIAEMNRLHAYVNRVLERAETAKDDRMVLAGVSQGQRTVEILAKLGPLGDIEKRLQALEEGSPHGGDDH